MSTIFADINVALAFGKLDLGPSPHARTEEEVQHERMLKQRQKEITDRTSEDILADPEKVVAISQVWLRPADINAALHAMALHRLSPKERDAVVAAKWVRVARYGDCVSVDFLQEPPEETAKSA
jgi:hypothetical protein